MEILTLSMYKIKVSVMITMELLQQRNEKKKEYMFKKLI